MKKGKKALLTALCITTVAAVGAAAGCGGEEGDKFTFNVQAELTAEVGTYFTVPSAVAKDASGEIYMPSITVKDPDGNDVIYEFGKFYVGKLGDYKVDYAVTYKDEEIKKTSKVTSVDSTAPTITLDKSEAYSVQGATFTIPGYTAKDNWSDKDTLTGSVKAFFGDTEIAITDGKIVLSETGDYLVKYYVKDEAGNTGERTLTVHAVQKDPGNITYWDKDFGVSAINSINGCEVAADSSVTLFGENYSLKAELKTPGFWPWIELTSPFVTDLNEKNAEGEYLYNYVYFYVYTENSGNTSICPNADEYYTYKTLTKGEWTKFLMYRDGETFKFNGTDIFGQYSNGKSSVNDITNFKIYINTHNETDNTEIYFSTIRAVKTLAEVSVDLKGNALCGATLNVPMATVTGSAAVTQTVKVVKPDGTKEIIDGATFDFANAGVYRFEFVVYADGAFKDVIYKTVTVSENDPGNVTYFDKEFGATIIGATNGATVTSVKDVHLFGEEYSLKVDLQAPGYWPWIKIASPFITDLNEKDAEGNYIYDYVYFYVYTENAVKTKVSPNLKGEYYGYTDMLTANEWTKVVIKRSGDSFIFGENNLDIFSDANNEASVNDISNFYIGFNTNRETDYTTVYLSTFRAVKTMTEISVAMQSSVWEGESVTVATATVIGETEVTQTVSVIKPDGTKQAVEGASYVLASAGNYTFEYAVYAGGKFIGVKYVTVSAMQKDPGNITYWNKDFGVNTISSEWKGVQSIGYSDEIKYGNEEGSLNVLLENGAWAYIKISAPYIKDLNAKDGNGEYLYDYVYFYVYTKDAVNTKVSPNLKGEYYGYTDKLTANEWTKVVMTRSGETFVFGSNNLDVFGSSKNGGTVNDITDFHIGFNTVDESAWVNVYFSAMRAVKTLPAE